MFRTALDRLGVRAEKSLMVGERWGWDGACTGLGLPALVIPPWLQSATDTYVGHWIWCFGSWVVVPRMS